MKTVAITPFNAHVRHARTALAVLLALGIAACSDDTSQAPASSTPSTTPAAAPAPAADTAAADLPESAPSETVAEISDRADDAVIEQRLFVPAGDNAFELYLSVIDADPEHTNARNAIIDLYPYAVMHVEQRLAANDASDAARVLALMEKANPQAPALPRLRTSLGEAQSRASAAAVAEAARAERAAQAAAPAPELTPTPAPPPPAATEPAPAPVVTPPTTPVATTPTPPPPSATTTPPPRTVTPPAPVRQATLPAVVNQVSPRYPPLALRRRIEGYAEVSFTVQRDGTVTDVAVVSSDPRSIFDREAVNAMQRWRFAPSAQESSGRRTFDFRLTDE